MSRQKEYLLSVLENYNRALELSADATQSAGLMQERYGIYLESTEAKLNKFKTTLQELYTTAISSGFVNWILDGATAFLKLTNSIGGLSTITMGYISIMVLLRKEMIVTSIVKSWNGLLYTIRTAKEIFTTMGGALRLARSQGQGLIQTFITVKTAIFGASSAWGAFVGVLGGVGIAVTAVVMIMKKLEANERERIQAMQDSIAKNDEQITALEDLKKRHEELYKLENKTTEQNKELAKIQNDVVKALGAKKGAIDLVNKSWEENKDVIDNATKAQLEWALSQQQQVTDDAQKQYDKSSKGGLQTGNYNGVIVQTQELRNDLNSIADELESSFGDKIKIMRDEYGDAYQFIIDKTKVTKDEIIGIQKEIVMTSQKYKSVSETGIFKGYQKEIADVVSAYDALQEQQQKEIEYRKKIATTDLGYKEEIVDIKQLGNIRDSITSKMAKIVDPTEAEAYKSILFEIDAKLAKMRDEAKTNPTGFDMTSMLGMVNTDNLSSEQAKLVSDALKTLSENGRLTYEQFLKLTQIMPVLSTVTGNALDLFVDMSSRMDSVRGTVDDYGSQMRELNSVMDDINEGTQLSGDKLVELVRKYPQLQSQIKTVNGVRTLEAKAIQGVKDGLESTTKAYFDNEISMTQTAMQQTKERIKLKLEEAKMLFMFEKLRFGDSGNFMPQNEQEARLRGNSAINDEINKYEELGALVTRLEKEKLNLDNVVQGTGEKDKKDNTAKYLEQGYQDAIDIIEAKSKELKEKISSIQSQIEFSVSKNGEFAPYTMKLKEELKSLQDEQTKLIGDSASQLRALQDKYYAMLTNGTTLFKNTTIQSFNKTDLDKATRDFDARIEAIGDSKKSEGLAIQRDRIKEIGSALLSLKDASKELSNDFIDNKKNKFELYLTEMQKQIEKTEEEYSNNEIQLNFKLAKLDETSPDYYKNAIDIEKEIVAQKIKLKNELARKYDQMVKDGYSKDLAQAKELASKKQQLEEEILEKRKALNEKYSEYLSKTSDSLQTFRGKVSEMLEAQDDKRKDAIKKQVDLLKEQKDTEKKILEDKKKALDKAKEEYDYQKKITDLRKSLIDIQSSLNALEFDDSADAIQSKIDLANNYNDTNDNLKDEMYNRQVELQKEAIDMMIDSLEKMYEKQIEMEQAKIDEKVDYQKLADTMIQKDADETYSKLIDWYKESGIVIDTEIRQAWDAVASSMDVIGLKAKGVVGSLNFLADKMYEINRLGGNIANMASVGNAYSFDKIPNMYSANAKTYPAMLAPKQQASQINVPVNIKVDGIATDKVAENMMKQMTTVLPTFLETAMKKGLNTSVNNVVGSTR